MDVGLCPRRRPQVGHSLTFTDFQSRIENPKPKVFKPGPGIKGRCPACAAGAHDKKGEHLAVWEAEGWIHVACVRGCTEADILGALGLDLYDRRTEKSDPKNTVKTFIYTDAKGGYLFEKVRYIKLDGEKAFVQQVRQRNGIPVPKVPGKKGGERYQFPSEAGIVEKPLYRLPDVLSHVKKGETVYICEGEKAADEFWRRGMAATCQPDGAGNGKWRAEHTTALIGASKVVIVADRDKDGASYGTQVFTAIRSAGIPVSVVRSKTTNEKDDAFDHFLAGFTVQEFAAAPDLMPKRGMKVRTATAAFVATEIRYLVDPYLPAGKCILFDADGGTGKTSLALAWAAALSRGLHPVTFKPLPGGPVKTLYLHKGEDTDDELETVYRANLGVPGMIIYAGEDLVLNEPGICELQDTILEEGTRFVVVDALFYFLHGVVKDAGVALDVMGVMKRLTDVARLTGATFLNIRHTTKGVIGKSASELGMGSVQFRNSHRGQLVARYHPDLRGAVVVTDEKGSLLVPKGDHFVYRRIGHEVQYLERIPNPFEGSGQATEKKSKEKQAQDIIRAMVTGVWTPSVQVYKACADAGISTNTVKAAGKGLSVEHRKSSASGGWLMYLPAPNIEVDGYDAFADTE